MRDDFNCDGDIPIQRRLVTHNFSFNDCLTMSSAEICTTPSPPSLPLHLLISLICCSKSPLPFYKNLHFYEANKWRCLHKDITKQSINTRVNTFQKRLLIRDVCMQIDMAQQDVSCSTMVKQCKHKDPVCERGQEKGLSRTLI